MGKGRWLEGTSQLGSGPQTHSLGDSNGAAVENVLTTKVFIHPQIALAVQAVYRVISSVVGQLWLDNTFVASESKQTSN